MSVRNRKYQMMLVMAGALLASCTSVPPGATALTESEIRQMVSGYTWFWKSGGSGAGMYFVPDGTAHLFWNGESHTTRWIARDGEYCYVHKEGDRCWGLFRKDGKLFHFSKWQPDSREPYEWNPSEVLARGRHIG